MFAPQGVRKKRRAGLRRSDQGSNGGRDCIGAPGTPRVRDTGRLAGLGVWWYSRPCSTSVRDAGRAQPSAKGRGVRSEDSRHRLPSRGLGSRGCRGAPRGIRRLPGPASRTA